MKIFLSITVSFASNKCESIVTPNGELAFVQFFVIEIILVFLGASVTI